MDTSEAAARNQAAKAAGEEGRVFDWDKAAQLIKDRKPKKAGAGLQADWEWTGGNIFVDGKPVFEPGTYLASAWCIPEIEIDGELIPCFKMKSEAPDWNAETVWPKSALKILRGE